MITFDHVAQEIPCSLVRYTDGQRLGRDLRPSFLTEIQISGENTPMEKSRDQDQGKGAVEQDQKNEGGNTSMQGQLGHRDEDIDLKGADSDLSG